MRHSGLNRRLPSRATLTLTPLVAIVVAGAIALAGCGSVTTASDGRILAVGAENQYANVIAQIGGRYVASERDREQPEHRPAYLRGQPERGRDGSRGEADRAERRWLRHIHEQDRVGPAKLARAG